MTGFVNQLLHLRTPDSIHALRLSYDAAYFPKFVVDVKVKGEAPGAWACHGDRSFRLQTMMSSATTMPL